MRHYRERDGEGQQARLIRTPSKTPTDSRALVVDSADVEGIVRIAWAYFFERAADE